MEKICCFAGHSELFNVDDLCIKLISTVENLIVKENINEFWVGNYGAFDKLSAKAITKLKRKYPEIKLNLIIPYLTSEINKYKKYYYEIYDNILMADIPLKTPIKARIVKCNQYMIKKSEYLVCFINHSWGGAAKTLEYAKKNKKIQIINLAEQH